MFNAQFMQFKKRVNSTQLPNPDSGITIPIEIIDASSIINPTIRLSYSNPTQLNYCYIPTFNRYYFITDWASDHNQWICNCTVDVLASFRTEILGSYQYIVRSASQFNNNIIDPTYPAIASWETTLHRFDMSYPPSTPPAIPYYPNSDPLPQYYVIGVANGGSFGQAQGAGVISYYLMTGHALWLFVTDYLLKSTNWLDDTSISSGVQKMLVNPLQYIVSLIQIPFLPDPTWTESRNWSYGFKFGWYYYTSPETEGNDPGIYILRERTKSLNVYVTIPKHPASRSLGSYVGRNWLNLNPYTEYKLRFFPFGEFPIDSSELYNANYLMLRVTYEIGTGLASIQAFADDNIAKRVVYAKTQWGIPTPLAQLTSDALSYVKADAEYQIAQAGATMQAGSGIVAALTGNFSGAMSGIGGAAISAGQAELNKFFSATEAQFPQLKIVGTGGSYLEAANAAITTDPVLIMKTVAPANEDIEDLGRPLCASAQISTLSGYCQTRDADISIGGTASECDKIKSYMNGGFFIE